MNTPERLPQTGPVLSNLSASLDTLSRRDTGSIDSKAIENAKIAIAGVGQAISQRIETGVSRTEAPYKVSRIAFREGAIRYFLEPTENIGSTGHALNDQHERQRTAVVDIGIDNDDSTDVGFVEGKNPYHGFPRLHVESVRRLTTASSSFADGFIINHGGKVERLYENILDRGIHIDPKELIVDARWEKHDEGSLEKFPFSRSLSPSTEDALDLQLDNWDASH